MKITGTNCLLIIGVFLVVNALKTALIYLPFNSDAGYEQLFVHFWPSLFLASAVFLFLLQRERRLLFLAAYLIQAAYLEINLCYYYYYHDILQLSYMYELMRESIDVARSFSFTVTAQMFSVILDLPLFLFILWHFRTTAATIRKKLLFDRMPGYGILLVLGALYVLNATVQAIRNDSTVKGSARDRAMVTHYGFVAHNIVDLLSGPDRTATLSKLVYGKIFKTTHERPRKSNIVMIQFESLDANIVNRRYKGEYIAPFMHELAGKSIYYPYALCYRKAGGTSDCEIAVINSIEPLNENITIHLDNYLYPNAVTKRLPKNCDIEAFHGNSGDFYHRDVAYLKMGFREFYDIDKMKLDMEGWGASDHNVLEYVEKRLASVKEPFFYYLITMSSHEPFLNVLHYYHDKRFQDIDHKLTRNYFTSISYVDAELRKFVTHVTSRFPDTYIFIYGDHTPFVINDGPYQRAVVRLDEKEMEFVPLFIITPDRKKYAEKNRVASYLDFAPTILSASGVSASILTPGTNLLDTPLRETHVNYRGSVYDRDLLFNLISNNHSRDLSGF